MSSKISSFHRKCKKLFKTPGVFFRDYFDKKYPDVYNEILCPQDEESILIQHDISLENQININFPIDVVFTWVNDKDPEWQRKYQFYCHIDPQRHGKYATDQARFSNHNELYYAIKSVVINLPWVRQIFVVTDNQLPPWLDEYPNVKVIDHTQIISHKYLPTFNSHVIEAHLHNIPSLAEHFIYFNDDVFVARPLPAGHFFKGNGLASIFLSRKSLVRMHGKGVVTPTLSASMNVREIINNDFSLSIDIPLVHTYVPLRKSVFDFIWQNYEENIAGFLVNKFRTNSDLNMATFMVPWFTYIKGLATPERDICHYFNVRSVSAKKNYSLLTKIKHEGGGPHSFCANDFTTTKSEFQDYQLALLSMLDFFYEKGKY